ncbi:MAG: head-tail connector protein [Gammaproteobacteria bacterium]|nr:head-tail connector protein [Gammaproteobacteria bacterium]
MSITTLESARRQLNVIGTSQDADIQDCIDSAEAYAEQFMNRPLVPWVSDSESSEDVVPADVRRAILLLVGDYFNLREASIVGTIFVANPAAENILHFHRKGLGI